MPRIAPSKEIVYAATELKAVIETELKTALSNYDSLDFFDVEEAESGRVGDSEAKKRLANATAKVLQLWWPMMSEIELAHECTQVRQTLEIPEWYGLQERCAFVLNRLRFVATALDRMIGTHSSPIALVADAQPERPSSGKQLPYGVVTAMFTDIVDSTKLKGLMHSQTSARRDEEFRRRIKEPHDAIVLPLVQEHGGEIVNPTGDGYCFVFADVEEAVLCAVTIQEALETHAVDTETEIGALKVKIGLHTGFAAPSKTDIVASAMDKAARVQGKAEGGQVLVSRETYNLAVGKLRGIDFISAGRFDLKGLTDEELFIAFRSGADPFAKAEAAYRDHLIDRFGKLTLYTVTFDAPLAVDLERVFVKLTATERVVDRQGDFVAEALALFKGRLIETGMSETEMGNLREQVRRDSRAEAGRTTTVSLSLSEALRAHDKCAVIGAPGSGKTTLLKYLALTFARSQAQERLELGEERLPIFVALRDLNRYLDNLDKRGRLLELTATLLADFARDHTKEVAPHLTLPSDFFARALAQGRAIVLLDGLDEVADPSKRSRAAETVASFVRHYDKCRFVVTSRPRGYEAEAKQRLSPLFDECTVREFEADDRKAFAMSWYTAVITDRLGDNQTARDEAATKAMELLAAIDKDTRIQTLASNPLMLTILALVHQQNMQLPERRAELYDVCCEFLLGYWDEQRGGPAALELAKFGGFDRKEKRVLIEPVALWLHERGEAGVQVEKPVLLAEIERQFRELFLDPAPQAKRRAELFLEIIEHRSGLIEERETGIYAFHHLTFQEYLAARAIAGTGEAERYLLMHLHDPWWREVVLLTVGHLSVDITPFGRKRTSNVVRAIRKTDSHHEDVLKRDLLLAARALADTGPLAVDAELRREIIDDAVKIWLESKWEPQRQEAAPIVALFMNAPEGEAIRERLLKELKDKESDVRSAAAYALGSLGEKAATESVLSALVAVLKDKESYVRSAAADALGRLGEKAALQQIVDGLEQMWKSELGNRDYVSFGDRFDYACNIAYAELQRLAALRAASESVKANVS